MLAEADDPAQLRCCLLDGALRYDRDMRESGSSLFMTLRAFIEDGEKWRPEYLEFNRRAA